MLLNIAGLVLTLASTALAAPSRVECSVVVDSADTGLVVVDIMPVKGRRLRDLLVAEATKAQVRGRTPFIELGAPWCEPCEKLRALLDAKPTDPRILKKFAGTYIIRINTDQWKKGPDDHSWRSMQSALGIDDLKGIPVFFAMNATGDVTGAIYADEWGIIYPERLLPLQKFFQKYSEKNHHTKVGQIIADTMVTDTTVIVVDAFHYPGSELKSSLQHEIAKAIALGRTPFVEIGATWCEPCRALKETLGDPRMIKAFAGTYIIRLDLDEWKEQLPSLKLATEYVPIFFAINKTGKGIGKGLIPRFKFGPGDDLPKQAAPQLMKFFQANQWRNEPGGPQT